jgi:hypothetical protein
MSELKPWEGPEDAAIPDEPKSGYLLGAGILAGLVFAIGSQALLGHFAARPELAAADPLMASLLVWTRWGGWALAGASGLGLLVSLGRPRKSL